MEIQISDIVRSTAGRDKGMLFLVIATEEGYAVLSDGRRRKLENAKRKKLKHLRFESRCESRAAQKLQSGEKVTNSELRRTLAEFTAKSAGAEGGMQNG